MANAVITVLEADGLTETDVTVLDVGRQAAAASKSLALATEDKAVLDAMAASLAIIDNLEVSLASDSPGVTALGQTTKSASLPVTIASDQHVAHDAADSGNPLKVGARAKGSLSAITLVAADDRADLFAGLDSIALVRPHSPLEDLVSNVVACTSGANTSAIASQGAGVKFYLCGGMIYNNGSTNGACLITDGSGGTTKLKVPFPASTGTVFTLPVPVGFSAATAVYADPSGSDTIDVTLYGFRSKV
jgi:hypothetical protein